MKFKITSQVHIGSFLMKHEYVHDIPDDSNVFGRVLDYHKHMSETFPKCEYRLLNAEELKKECLSNSR